MIFHPKSIIIGVCIFLLFCFSASGAVRNKIRCISDLHIASPWFVDKANQEQLSSLLAEMANPETEVKRLVIVGDFIEMWLYPFNKKPKSAKAILNSERLFKTNVLAFMKQFRKIVENGVELDIVVGNHDLELKFAVDDLKEVIASNINVHEEEFVYNGVVRFEHGHRYDLFNAPDPRGYRPVGYYISRSVASVNYGDGSGEQAKSIQICRKLDPDVFSDLSVFTLRSSFVFGTALELMFDEVLGDYETREL